MLRSRLVAGANTVTFFLYFALNGMIFFLVLRLQQVQGYSPTEAGLAMLPPILLITFLAAPAGALADRIGPRLQMVLGPATVALGMALLAIGGPEASYLEHFLPGLALFGIGMALVIAPVTKSALAVEPRWSGAASGFNNSVSRIAALMAVAVLGAIVLSTFGARLGDELSLTSLAPEQQQELLDQANKLGAIGIPDDFDENERMAADLAIKTSFVHGYRWAMVVCALLALAGAAVSLVTIRSSRHPPPGSQEE
jgi:MFS family permease